MRDDTAYTLVLYISRNRVGFDEYVQDSVQRPVGPLGTAALRLGKLRVGEPRAGAANSRL